MSALRGVDPASFDAIIETVLSAARIPGAAIAVVERGEVIFAKAYGYRDLHARAPMTLQTHYPIASTSKAINATLIAMLVEEGRLGWDVPVQQYLPGFRLGDAVMSAQVTLRDLVAMRTGLPRHDWLWTANPIQRSELVARLRHLELSAGFRERFQYNNLTVTTAGHIAEVVTGEAWETLVQQRIVAPLGMSSTTFSRPDHENVTVSYHENQARELVVTRLLATEVTAPSGGSIHSTVENMARWVAFNLEGGRCGGKALMKAESLAALYSPQVVAGTDSVAPTPGAAYGLGWFIDTYNGSARISHGGYLHDVNSHVSLFPEHGIGMVSFINFGPPRLARLINQLVFDAMLRREPAQTLAQKLDAYERAIDAERARLLAVPRVAGTSPSRPLEELAGTYRHPGYGDLRIQARDGTLVLVRNELELPLEHWHYDAWVLAENDLFQIDVPHSWDRSKRLLFEASADGPIAAVTMRLEPKVAPIRFARC